MTNPDEYALQFRLRHLGFTIFTPEILICGCLTQTLDVLSYEITETGVCNNTIYRESARCHIMISGIQGGNKLPEPLEMAKKIKAFVVDDPYDSSLVERKCSIIADRVKRTAKFLAGINRGCCIVNLQWLKDSVKMRTAQDVNLNKYHLVDEEAESKWGFTLSNSLKKARQRKLFRAWNIWVSDDCQPNGEELKLIVETGGGKLIDERPYKFSEDTLCICTPKETATQQKLKDMG